MRYRIVIVRRGKVVAEPPTVILQAVKVIRKHATPLQSHAGRETLTLKTIGQGVLERAEDDTCFRWIDQIYRWIDLHAYSEERKPSTRRFADPVLRLKRLGQGALKLITGRSDKPKIGTCGPRTMS